MITIRSTGREDDWGRPIYTDETGRKYVDINLGCGVPDIHTINNYWDEPEDRLQDYEIIPQSVRQ